MATDEPTPAASVRGTARDFLDAAAHEADVAELTIVERGKLTHRATIVAIALDGRADLIGEVVDRHDASGMLSIPSPFHLGGPSVSPEIRRAVSMKTK